MSPHRAAATHSAVDPAYDTRSSPSDRRVSRAHASLSSLPLPAGWEARLCASPRIRTRDGTHRVVFLNHEERVTTWNDPRLRLLLPPSLHTLPVGWTLDLDKDGEPYFLDDTACATCRRPSWLSPQQHEDLNRFYKHFVIGAAAAAARQALDFSGSAGTERQCPPYTAPPPHHSNPPFTVHGNPSAHHHDQQQSQRETCLLDSHSHSHSHSHRHSRGDCDHSKSDSTGLGRPNHGSCGGRPRTSPTTTTSSAATAPSRDSTRALGLLRDLEADAGLFGAGTVQSTPPQTMARHHGSVHAGTASALLYVDARAPERGHLHPASEHGDADADAEDDHGDADGVRGMFGLHEYMCEAWPLSTGWTGHTCSETGDPYFVHTHTRRVTWTHPALARELAGVAVECLPEDWDVDFDEDGLFFVNHAMQMATRNAPEPLIRMATDTSRPPPGPADGHVPAQPARCHYPDHGDQQHHGTHGHGSRLSYQDSTTTIVPGVAGEECEDECATRDSNVPRGSTTNAAAHEASILDAPDTTTVVGTAAAMQGVRREVVDLLTRRALPKISLGTQRALSDCSMDSGLESGPVTGSSSAATSTSALCRNASISQASLDPSECCSLAAPVGQRCGDDAPVAARASFPPAHSRECDEQGSDSSSTFSVSSLASYLTSMWSARGSTVEHSRGQAARTLADQEAGEDSHVTVHFV